MSRFERKKIFKYSAILGQFSDPHILPLLKKSTQRILSVSKMAPCGRSSVGRALPSQGKCREFESHCPLRHFDHNAGVAQW